jgi:hypothetical protein
MEKKTRTVMARPRLEQKAKTITMLPSMKRTHE